MEDKELGKVRSQFVDKVSKEVINQLLDDLLEDGILNEGEKDSILEENNSRADKARCLVDRVKKKGPEASRKLIAHLQKRDLTLYKELGLSCGQPAPPAAAPQMEQEWSTTVTSTTPAFWREKQNNDEVYPGSMKSIGNRIALLITNIKFTIESWNRKGAEKDEENMEKLLRSLGYEVVKYTDLTAKEIDKALIKFSKHPKLKETDSVLVVIMSHGKLGAVLGVGYKKEVSGDEEQDEFPIDNIYKHLGSEKCPALLNKPKIIIIQACRGGQGGSVLVSDDATSAVVSDNMNIEDDTWQFVPKEKDFISLLSCTPGTVAYRETCSGSFLIQYLVEVLNTFAHKDHIEDLFTKVMRRFEKFPDPSKRQMATKDRCTLTRHFYFFPGL